LKHKGFSVFEKSFVFGVYGAYLKNRMIHTSHFNIGAKNTLTLMIIFRGSWNTSLLSFFSLICSLFRLFTSYLSTFI